MSNNTISNRIIKHKKAKNKDKSDKRENEQLRGKIRELMKEVNYYKRLSESRANLQDLSKEEVSKIRKEKKEKREQNKRIEENISTCKACGKGNEMVTEIYTPSGNILIITCTTCNHNSRQKVKND